MITAALYLINIGVDAEILAAVPLGGTKLYGGLRGFGDFALAGGLGGAAALTVGGVVSLDGDSSVLLELTFLTNLYNGAAYLVFDPVNPLLHTPQPVGFSLVPALGFNF